MRLVKLVLFIFVFIFASLLAAVCFGGPTETVVYFGEPAEFSSADNPADKATAAANRCMEDILRRFRLNCKEIIREYTEANSREEYMRVNSLATDAEAVAKQLVALLKLSVECERESLERTVTSLVMIRNLTEGIMKAQRKSCEWVDTLEEAARRSGKFPEAPEVKPVAPPPAPPKKILGGK